MANITTSDELRLFNRTRILASLRIDGRQSRTCLRDSTGLSASTVSQVTADLIHDGVIERMAPEPQVDGEEAVSNRRGRPQVMLQLNARAAATAVVTLLLNELEVTLYDYCGESVQRSTKRLKTTGMTLATLKKHLYGLLDDALAAGELGESSLHHIALVCQGTVTRDSSGLVWSPITRLKNIDLRGILQERYNVAVTVANDCNMIARAIYDERLAQANGREDDHFAVILSSYGIGLGYFHQGDILTGSYSSGTEFGHMLFEPNGALCRCGRRGCIEAYASDYAIWRRARGLPADSEPSDHVPEDEFKQLIETARRKAGPERKAFEVAGAAIGQGLSNLFAIFDPFPAMLIGVTPEAFELMKSVLFTNLQHYRIEDGEGSISVYDQTTERQLILKGACSQSLSYIDEQIFGFGGSSMIAEPVAS